MSLSRRVLELEELVASLDNGKRRKKTGIVDLLFDGVILFVLKKPSLVLVLTE